MPENEKVVIAEPGDILMARVDRSLHQKIAIVTKGRAAITDCVYRVRVPVEHQKRVFTALRSTHGEQAILSATKGVSARLLGKGTLLGLRLQEPLAS
jgi:type I restriction enzyme M protein